MLSLTGFTIDASPNAPPRRSSTPSTPFSPEPITAPSFVFPDESITLPNFLDVLIELAEQELRVPDVEDRLESLDSSTFEWPIREQDEYNHEQFEDPIIRGSIADIHVEHLPPPVAAAPIFPIPSPTPATPSPTPTSRASTPLSEYQHSRALDQRASPAEVSRYCFYGIDVCHCDIYVPGTPPTPPSVLLWKPKELPQPIEGLHWNRYTG